MGESTAVSEGIAGEELSGEEEDSCNDDFMSPPSPLVPPSWTPEISDDRNDVCGE